MGSDMDTDAGVSKRKGKRRLLWGLCTIIGLFVLVAGTVWWTMIRMPGRSYHGELPVPDEKLISLATELRNDLAQLAVEIGERNIEATAPAGTSG